MGKFIANPIGWNWACGGYAYFKLAAAVQVLRLVGSCRPSAAGQHFFSSGSFRLGIDIQA
jgi:hypothetical protein